MTIGLNVLAPAALGTVARVAGSLADVLKGDGKQADKQAEKSSALGEARSTEARTLTERLQALDPMTADKIRRTSQDFEAMFMENMLNQVFASTGDEGPLGENGTGGDTYKSMLLNEYARTITKSGGVGIADSVMAEMIKIQEAAGGAR